MSLSFVQFRSQPRRAVAALLVAMLALAVSACMLMPGRFVSELDVRRDGRFSFTYSGEIHLLALSKLAESDRAGAGTFAASPCHNGDSGRERACTARELADQKTQWEARRQERAERRKRDAESMKPFLGGIDPDSPAAAEELAQRLRRQAGWRRVTYKGDGLFDVDFAITGRLDHDFAFPTIERFPLANGFVQVALRQDGSVRIDAPGFGPATGSTALGGLMQGAMLGRDKDTPDGMPVIDGKFTIRTDAQVLANNTDDGPRPDPAGQRLDWLVTLRSQAAPMALLRP
jgi:hypothetical protein